MKTILRVLALCTLTLASIAAWPKSQITGIAIVGPSLAAPLEITDPAILERFNIWNGPGVRVNGQQIHLNSPESIGAFIDWPRGPLPDQPAIPGVYTVTFRLGGREPMREWHRSYVVKYAYDPAAPGGYIYLPGRNDGEVYERNVFSIGHGVEGNWFHSAPAWEQFVRPAITKAAAR